MATLAELGEISKKYSAAWKAPDWLQAPAKFSDAGKQSIARARGRYTKGYVKPKPKAAKQIPWDKTRRASRDTAPSMSPWDL